MPLPRRFGRLLCTGHGMDASGSSPTSYNTRRELGMWGGKGTCPLGRVCLGRSQTSPGRRRVPCPWRHSSRGRAVTCETRYRSAQGWPAVGLAEPWSIVSSEGLWVHVLEDASRGDGNSHLQSRPEGKQGASSKRRVRRGEESQRHVSVSTFAQALKFGPWSAPRTPSNGILSME